jgi:hypothetical protein
METKQLRLVTFEQAKRLKALGFNWEVSVQDIFYLNIKQPTIALALKWIRDKKEIVCIIDYIHTSDKYYGYYRSKTGKYYYGTTSIFDTYEAVEDKLLDELLTVLEKRHK